MRGRGMKRQDGSQEQLKPRLGLKGGEGRLEGRGASSRPEIRKTEDACTKTFAEPTRDAARPLPIAERARVKRWLQNCRSPAGHDENLKPPAVI